MKKLSALLLSVMLLLSFAACGNPIKEAVTGGEPETPPAIEQPEDTTVPAGKPQDAEQPEDAKEPTSEELQELLFEKLGKNDPATGDEYDYMLQERVSDKAGQEYYLCRWVRVIYDLDSNSKVPSLLAELFLTPDGERCYIGNYFPENEGNGETVVLTTGDIFDPAEGFVTE